MIEWLILPGLILIFLRVVLPPPRRRRDDPRHRPKER